MEALRKIIHIDMDAFFASVEQRDNPELRGKPIAVGSEQARGVVATASYEARKFGVHSAMPSSRARQLCPSLIFVAPRFEVYKEVSGKMHEIFHEYTDIIEPISVDEAFLDVTHNKPGISLAVEVAKEIKQKIRERLNLTASAGISYNKFLAKIASDLRKPDGLATIHPSIAQDFIDRLKVRDFWGVGPKTSEKFGRLGINTGADLRKLSLDFLHHEFGKAGIIFYSFARGIDNRPVEAVSLRKSVGCEETYLKDLNDYDSKAAALGDLAEDLSRRLERHDFNGYTLTLKIKFADFTVRNKSYTRLGTPVRSVADIKGIALKLLDDINCDREPVRLLGLSVSNPPGAKDRPEKYYDPRQLQLEFDKYLSSGLDFDMEV